MKKKATDHALNISRVIPRIQSGLKSIHAARIRIEEIVLTSPESSGTEQLLLLVQPVQKNIAEIVSAIDQIEQQYGSNPKHIAVINKLRHDVTKEQVNYSVKYHLEYYLIFTVFRLPLTEHWGIRLMKLEKIMVQL
jgi:hypothetical protein